MSCPVMPKEVQIDKTSENIYIKFKVVIFFFEL